jgi:outer membrane protein assembly factor BamA
MHVRQVLAATLAAPLLSCALHATPRCGSSCSGEQAPVRSGDRPTIEHISFVGLRRIAPEAVAAQIASRAGDSLDPGRIARDVRNLGRLGWFASVRVEEIDDAAENPTRVRLKFCLEEHPFLSGVEFRGSRLLSQQQIEKLLAGSRIVMRFGEPENQSTWHQAASAIRFALAELGHPDAQVRLRREESPLGSVRVRFEIVDGPHLPVGQVTFEGHPAVSTKVLRRQMRRLQPDVLFAAVRGKNAYTQESFAEDRERLLAYYQNHGYPEARVGTAQVRKVESASRPWLPWPRTKRDVKLRVAVPVEAGPLYRVESLQTSETLRNAAATARSKPPDTPAEAKVGRPYSAQAIETLRRAWQSRLQSKGRRAAPNGAMPLSEPEAIGVETIRTLDAGSHGAHIYLDQSATPPYLLRRLEFNGIHRFPDRYFRRRIPLIERAAFDDRALEVGLARLARTSYFKPIKNEDVHVMPNDVNRTVDVTIHIEQLGQQRASIVGGHGQFGSTLGIVYTVFNFFHGEELLSSQIEGGPDSLQLAIGFAEEGFLGTRGSLALSLFNTLLRPRLSGSAKGPFFRQQSEGVSGTWSYQLNRVDSLSVRYDLSRTSTRYSPMIPDGATGLAPGDIHTQTSSRAAGLGWTRDTGAQRITLVGSVSGGLLGGTENVVHSRAEYGRTWHDSLFDPRNAWAVHTNFNGVGTYAGDLPLYTRLFAGDDFVRGLGTGALGPLAVISSVSSSGTTNYSAAPAGASLVGAANAEYRVRLNSSAEVTSFFDIGSGTLLRNWLGTARPALIDATSRVLHASTGFQVQWTMPGVSVPLRAYYAVNLQRLDRWLPMPDGSYFHAREPWAAFGWALAPMF